MRGETNCDSARPARDPVSCSACDPDVLPACSVCETRNVTTLPFCVEIFVSLPIWVFLTAHHGDEEGHEEGDEEGGHEEGGHEGSHEEARDEEAPLDEEGPQVSVRRPVTRGWGPSGPHHSELARPASGACRSRFRRLSAPRRG